MLSLRIPGPVPKGPLPWPFSPKHRCNRCGTSRGAWKPFYDFLSGRHTCSTEASPRSTSCSTMAALPAIRSPTCHERHTIVWLHNAGDQHGMLKTRTGRAWQLRLRSARKAQRLRPGWMPRSDAARSAYMCSGERRRPAGSQPASGLDRIHLPSYIGKPEQKIQSGTRKGPGNPAQRTSSSRR